MPPYAPVTLDQAAPPLVLATDIGSGSVRTALFDRYARPVIGHSATRKHAFTEAFDGTAEIDSEMVVQEVFELVSEVTRTLLPSSIAAFALDTFAPSLLCVDSSGTAISPCFTYADSRNSAQVERLRAELEETRFHQSTGVPFHSSYIPARLLWLNETHPELFRTTARFLSLGEYVLERLAGAEGSSVSSAAWSGLLNRNHHALDADLLNFCQVGTGQFSPIADSSRSGVTTDSAKTSTWPALNEAVWFPSIPDGYASNLGVGANSPSIAAVSLATSGAVRVLTPNASMVGSQVSAIPEGLWSYSVSSTQSLVGGALNDVGRVMRWLRSSLAPVSDADLHRTLTGPPTPGTPLVLPFFTGERSTGWATDAQAVFAGVTSATSPLDLWRGACEGIAVSYARIFRQLQTVDSGISTVVTSGGAGRFYPGLLNIITQAIGFPIQVIGLEHMTLRGSAVYALDRLDPGSAVSVVEPQEVLLPDAQQSPYYLDLEERFNRLYNATVRTKLVPSSAS